MGAFESSLPPDLSVLAALRHGLSAWLEHAGVPEQLRLDIVLATHEAAANAIEHAQAPYGPGYVNVNVTDSFVTVEVRDSGSWKVARAEDERGRGLDLMQTLVGDLQIGKNPRGTTVRFRYSLTPENASPED